MQRKRNSHLLLRRSVKSAVHGADAGNQAQSNNSPGIGRHEPEGPSARMEGTSSNADDTDTKTSMQEGIVQIAPLEGRHTSIFSCLTVEDDVRSDNGAADNGSTVDQLLRQVARALGSLVSRLHICPATTTESILEGLTSL